MTYSAADKLQKRKSLKGFVLRDMTRKLKKKSAKFVFFNSRNQPFLGHAALNLSANESWKLNCDLCFLRGVFLKRGKSAQSGVQCSSVVNKLSITAPHQFKDRHQASAFLSPRVEEKSKN